ncbi:MAG: PorV/PorQ family protein [Elusimicrobiota bacterium]
MNREEARKTDALNSLIWWLSRPYALFLGLAFLFTPSCTLLNALETGAEFLNIDPSARSAAMGNAQSALALGAESAWSNPAGLLGLRGRELAFMKADWPEDGAYSAASFAAPISGGWMGAFSFARLDYGGFQGRDDNRALTGSFEASDKSFALSAAGPLGGGVGFGVTARHFSSHIAGRSASALSADAGVTARLPSAPVRVGLAVRNLGGGLDYGYGNNRLPLSVSLGAAVNVLPGMALAADVKRLVYDRETTVSVGTEYMLGGSMMMRGGYAAQMGGADVLGGFSGGLGIKMSGLRLDYSFTPFAGFGSSKRLTMALMF